MFFLPVYTRFIPSLKNYKCHVNPHWNLVTRVYGTVIFKISATCRELSPFLCLYKVGSIFCRYLSDLSKIVHGKLTKTLKLITLPETLYYKLSTAFLKLKIG